MTDYKQCDPEWALEKYDGVNSFCKSGCLVTCLADLTGKTPPEVAEILRNGGCFTDGYINDHEKAAKLLGLEWHGKSTTKPNYDTVAETLYYGTQHFFVIKANGERLDPLGGAVSDYKINSYRLYKKGDDMSDDMLKDVIRNIVDRWYLDYLNRKGSDQEIESHTNALFVKIKNDEHPQWVISEWIRHQKDEAEFKAIWHTGTSDADALSQCQTDKAKLEDKIAKAQEDLK